MSCCKLLSVPCYCVFGVLSLGPCCTEVRLERAQGAPQNPHQHNMFMLLVSIREGNLKQYLDHHGTLPHCINLGILIMILYVVKAALNYLPVCFSLSRMVLWVWFCYPQLHQHMAVSDRSSSRVPDDASQCFNVSLRTDDLHFSVLCFRTADTCSIYYFSSLQFNPVQLRFILTDIQYKC